MSGIQPVTMPNTPIVIDTCVLVCVYGVKGVSVVQGAVPCQCCGNTRKSVCHGQSENPSTHHAVHHADLHLRTPIKCHLYLPSTVLRIPGMVEQFNCWLRHDTES
jgi:hypothetical protein